MIIVDPTLFSDYLVIIQFFLLSKLLVQYIIMSNPLFQIFS